MDPFSVTAGGFPLTPVVAVVTLTHHGVPAGKETMALPFAVPVLMLPIDLETRDVMFRIMTFAAFLMMRPAMSKPQIDRLYTVGMVDAQRSIEH